MPVDGPCRPFLLNPFSMARILLPRWTEENPIFKIVMSAAPGSESFVVAAIVDRTVCDGENRRSIAACRPGERQGAWWRHPGVRPAAHLVEISILFHEGKLHALRSCDHLVEQVFDDGKLSSGSR